MVKKIILGLVVVGVCSLGDVVHSEEELLGLVYERPYLGQEKYRALGKEVEYQPLFLVEGEFTQKEATALGMKVKATKGNEKTVSMCYPKVVLLKKGEQGEGKSREKELLFMDKFGKVKKQIKMGTTWAEVFWSKNNKYLCVYAISKVAEWRYKTSIFDADGNELWSFEGEPISEYWVSPNGEYVIEQPDVDWGGTSYIILHYQDGNYKKIETSQVLGGAVYYPDISENGEYFCVAGGGGYLALFDKHGKELWITGGGFGTEYCYFLKSAFIGGVASRHTDDEIITYFRLFDINGNLLWENKVFLAVLDVCYLEDEGRVYVLSGWGHFFCFDAKTGKLLAKYSDEHAPASFPSWKVVGYPFDESLAPTWCGIIINPDSNRVITLNARSIYYKGKTKRIDIFDKNLKKIGEKEHPQEDYIVLTFTGPLMKFSKDNLLSIITKKGGLKSYAIK